MPQRPVTTDQATELTKDEARAMLVEGDEVHTFRDTVANGAGFLIGTDVRREAILRKIAIFPCYRSGPGATGMGHGLCIVDIADMPLFVQTEPDAEAVDDEDEDDDGDTGQP